MTNPANDPVPDAPLRDELRAWADDIIRVPGMVVPADVRRAVLDILERHAAPVSAEDTDTPAKCGAKDGEFFTCALPAGHDGAWHEDANAGRAWITNAPDCKCGNPGNPDINHAPHGSNGFCVAPSTVDSGTRQLIEEPSARARIQDVLHREGCDDPCPGHCWEEAVLIVAALPELAEADRLRAERDEWKHAAEAEAQGRAAERDALSLLLRGMARRARDWRTACVVAESGYAKAISGATRPYVKAHVYVTPESGKPFGGTVLFADGTHLWVSPDGAPNVAGRYLPEQLAVIT